MNYDMMAKKKKSVDSVRAPRQWLLMTGALISMLMLLGGRAGWTQEIGTTPSVSSQLATELVRYFPPVTGEVIKVDGRHIYVDLGVKDEVWTGLRLTVFREGEALKHPTTGAVVGYDELPLGHITLVRLSETHSVGVYIPSAEGGPSAEGEAVQPGDKVRLTAGRISVSLLPPVGPLPANVSAAVFSTQLKGDLEATGRFRVVGTEQVNAWLLERGLAAAVQSPYLQMLTKSLKTPYVVQPALKAAQGQSILSLRLLAATQTEPVAEASAVLASGTAVAAAPSGGKAVPVPAPMPDSSGKLGGLVRQPLQAQPGRSTWNIAEGMTELHRFDDELIGFDTGDLDGDGRVEVVIATESRISLYQLSEQNLQLIDSFQANKYGHFLSAQLIQLDPGGALGIVVNQQVDTDGINSFVLTLRGQQLAYWQKHIYETLLAVDSDGDGINDRIWGQLIDQALFFSRDAVREYIPSNGKLQFQNNLKVSYSFRATGAALVRLGAETGTVPHLIFVDERNRLRIYRGVEKLWESSDFAGGSYAEALLGQGGEVDIPIGKIITNAFPFEPIPKAIDVDGDGVEEVLVIRNGASLGGVIPNRTRFKTGDVALLRAGPYGYGLSPVSPKFDGMVSGVGVGPNPAPGVLIAISKRQGILGRKKQTIIFLSRLPLS